MRHKNFDLMAATGTAVFNIVLLLLPVHIEILQVISALPLIFMWPGYLLTEAFFQKRPAETLPRAALTVLPGLARPLNTLERFTLSIGLSVAIAIIGGFLLNLLPEGLTPRTWATVFAIVIIVLVVVVITERFYVHNQGFQQNTPHVPGRRLSLRQVCLFGLAGLLVAFTLAFSVHSAEQQPSPGFTQFWMLPPNLPGQSCAVQLGIRNFEGTSVTYRVVMTVNGVPVQTWSSIALASQQEWDHVVPITLNQVKKLTKNTEIEAQLYRMDTSSVVYRQVHIYLPVLVKSPDGKTLLCGTS